MIDFLQNYQMNNTMSGSGVSGVIVCRDENSSEKQYICMYDGNPETFGMFLIESMYKNKCRKYTGLYTVGLYVGMLGSLSCEIDKFRSLIQLRNNYPEHTRFFYTIYTDRASGCITNIDVNDRLYPYAMYPNFQKKLDNFLFDEILNSVEFNRMLNDTINNTKRKQIDKLMNSLGVVN